MTTAIEHRQFRLGHRPQEEQGIGRGWCDLVVLALDHQQRHRQPGAKRWHVVTYNAVHRLHEASRVGSPQGLLDDGDRVRRCT